jgi:hypothetical protein
MRIIFGVLLALLMVLVLMFTFAFAINGHDARAPDTVVAEIQMRENLISQPDLTLVLLPRAENAELFLSTDTRPRPTTAANKNDTLEDSLRYTQAWCPEVTLALKCPSLRTSNYRMRDSACSTRHGLLLLTGERDSRNWEM